MGSRVILLALALLAATASHAGASALLVSDHPDRINALPLAGATIGGALYAFVIPDGPIQQVRFYVDDPTLARSPARIEGKAPYDLAGTAVDQTAQPYDVARLATGIHTVSAAVDRAGASVEVLQAMFRVPGCCEASAGPTLRLSLAPDRSDPAPLDGAAVAGPVFVFLDTPEIFTEIRFYIDDPQRLRAPFLVERKAPYDLAGTAADTSARPYDTTRLAQGTHTVTATFPLADGTLTVLQAHFTAVADARLFANPAGATLTVERGQTAAIASLVTAADGAAVPLSLETDVPWLTTLAGSRVTPAMLSSTIDAGGLVPGLYSGSVSIRSPGRAPASISLAVEVTDSVPADQLHLTWAEEPSTAMTVVWRTLDPTVPSRVEYRVTGTTAWQVASGGLRPSGTDGTLHEVTLRGLVPSTSYDYRVAVETTRTSRLYRTRTAPPPGPADFDAIYVADTGLIGRIDHLTTGTQQVIAEIARLDPLLVLLGGDLAYFDTDARFPTLDRAIDAWFLQVAAIGGRSPMMPAYGNHEALLGEGVEQWAARFPTPPGFDGPRNYSFDVGDVHLVSIFAVENAKPLTPETFEWLRQDLLAARQAGQRWLLPFFHVSPFADGDNHPSNNKLRAQLGPLFERLGVKVSLSSHDQAYERTYPLVDVPATNTPTASTVAGGCYTLDDGVTWVKTSPGGKLSNLNHGFSQFRSYPAPSWTAYRDNTMHHFAHLHVSADGALRVEALGLAGAGAAPVVLDAFEYRLDGCPGRLAFHPATLSFALARGEQATTTITLGGVMGGSAAPAFTSDVAWLGAQPDGGVPGRVAVAADARTVVPGLYLGAIHASAAGLGSDVLPVFAAVGEPHPPHRLLVSHSPNRALAVPLQGEAVRGDAYVFVETPERVTQVRFFFDDPQRTKSARQTERTAPYDFVGGASGGGDASPFDTTTVRDGAHLITAAIDRLDGGADVIHGAFVIANDAP
jgi:hypothetical protein